MKNFITILSFLVSVSTFAQYNSSSPQVFRTYLNSGGHCPTIDYRGSISYDTQQDEIFYCTGAFKGSYAHSFFKDLQDGIAYTDGNVGISNGQPTYNLDLSTAGDGRFINSILITDKLGIGTNTPTEKVDIVDKYMQIRSSTDLVTWRQVYYDASHQFNIAAFGGGGVGSIVYFIANGNVGIGNGNPTTKLAVSGTGSYAGDVLVGGKGLLYNSSSSQLKIYPLSFSISVTTFNVQAGGCSTYGVAFPGGTFTSAPTIALGTKLAGSTADQGINISIEAVNASNATVRFCNSTDFAVSLVGQSYNLLCLGGGN